MYVRHGTITHAGMLLSRNGTTTGRYMILAYDVIQKMFGAVMRAIYPSLIEVSRPIHP